MIMMFQSCPRTSLVTWRPGWSAAFSANAKSWHLPTLPSMWTTCRSHWLIISDADKKTSWKGQKMIYYVSCSGLAQCDSSRGVGESSSTGRRYSMLAHFLMFYRNSTTCRRKPGDCWLWPPNLLTQLPPCTSWRSQFVWVIQSTWHTPHVSCFLSQQCWKCESWVRQCTVSYESQTEPELIVLLHMFLLQPVWQSFVLLGVQDTP